VPNPVERMTDLEGGMEQLGDAAPELMAAFIQMDNAAYVEGELERRHKELMAIAVSVAVRCPYCITLHVKQCFELGANREEILEAASVGVAFGGSPSMSYTAAVLMPALEEYED
jgi:AhpD family alkylhydroperoxidase